MALRPTVLKNGVIALADASDDLDITSIATLTGAQVLSGKTLGGDLAAAGFTVSGLREPTAVTDAATKNYVDVSASGLQPKDSVVVISPINVNLAAPGANLDGVAMAPGGRFGAFAQGVGTQTGIYVWNGAAVAATRATDFAAGSHVAGAYFGVDSGTSAGITYRVNNPSATDEVGINTITVVVFQFAPVDGPAATPSLRTLGTGAAQAAAGDDPRMLANGEMGRVCVVDQLLGSDVTGTRSGLPFATIAAALAAALSGDCVWVMPGTYNLTAPIVMPGNVTMAGLACDTVTIQWLGVVAATNLVTMTSGSYISDIDFVLTSAVDVDLVGVVFPGDTSATAGFHDSSVTIDNTAAPGAAPSNVYGVHSTGNGVPAVGYHAIDESSIAVHGRGAGAKRGILLSTAAAQINVRASTVTVDRVGPVVGIYYGVETNFAGGEVTIDTSHIDGADSDISSTIGTVSPTSGVVLENNTANGRPVGMGQRPQITPLLWCDTGALPNGTNYMWPGTATPSAAEPKIRLNQPRLIIGIHVRVITPPGGVVTDTWTVRVNGVDTAMTATLTGAEVEKLNTSVSAPIAAGSDISLKVVKGVGSATTQTVVAVYIW